MKIAVYRNEKDNLPRVGDVTWEQLAQDLCTHDRTPCNPCAGHECPEKFGAAWSPVEIPEGLPRAAKNVLNVTAAVFDLDNIPDARLLQLAPFLKGKQYVFHSTHTGRSPQGIGSYRLIFPLSRPVLPGEWEQFWGKCVQSLQLPADAKARDIARIFFYPSASANGPEPIVDRGVGEPLAVDGILGLQVPWQAPPATAATPIESPLLSAPLDLGPIQKALGAVRRTEIRPIAERLLARTSIAPVGERDNSINQAASLLATAPAVTPTEAEAMAILSPCISAMETAPEGETYWQAKGLDCYRRAIARRAQRDAQHESDRAQVFALAGLTPPAPGRAPAAWRQDLITKKDPEGNPSGFMACEQNIDQILTNDDAWRGTLRWNEVTKAIDVFGGPLEKVALGDIEFATSTWFQRSDYRIFMKPHVFGPALLSVARKQSYDPLAEYLNSCKWDGVERIATFLARYCWAMPAPHVNIVSRKWFISLVARALQPGCKVDTVLILAGDYGVKKSTLLETLGGPFYTNGKINFNGDKDSKAIASRYWLVELAELASMRKADREAIKDWMSTRVDVFRPPYARVLESFPRRAVFAGTTNESWFLPEPNRREWVIRVQQEIDLGAVAAIRDQLFAEAVQAYRSGENWYLAPDDAELAKLAAEEYAVADPIKEVILHWWVGLALERRPEQFTMMDLLSMAFQITKENMSRQQTLDIGRALSGLGFKRIRRRLAGTPQWVYVPNEGLKKIPHNAKANAVELVPDAEAKP